MSHAVHAVQHEAEHQIKHDSEHGGHGGGHKDLLDARNKKVALLIAVLALCLAFSETLGKSAQTNAISFNVEASNLWAFFQAKTIRQTMVQTGTEILKLDLVRESGDAAATKAALTKRIQSWEQIAARYNTEPMDRPVRKEVNINPPYGEGRRELMALAMAAEKKRDTSLERYHHYEVASAAFQIGIVLASATVITGMVLLSFFAAGLGVVGLGFMAIGLFAPHAVHLF
ncbi:MAG: DUF4337 domain-containing protein [Alphaproteobacteria bacterium]|nr:DUF4337 domain-containing protein [Alphaproteobacteria bacterium]